MSIILLGTEEDVMPIPRHNQMYLPFLEFLGDGQTHAMAEIIRYLAKIMHVTEEERKEMLPSGVTTKFGSRVGWTRTYLGKAGLLETAKRGVVVISIEGKRVLSSKPAIINDDYLMQFEGFREFKTPVNSSNIVSQIASEATPQDELEDAFQKINSALVSELLSEIMCQTPAFFESLVVQLLIKMGYGGSLSDAGKILGKTGDEGIDGVVREDKLGFDLIYIQAKRWDLGNVVGRPEIQKFVGALAGAGASKGLFITTAGFSKDAYTYAEKQHTTKVVLVDGKTLASLMIEYNLGVSTQTIYELKRVDTDFFSLESE
jgi:restriction system protein